MRTLRELLDEHIETEEEYSPDKVITAVTDWLSQDTLRSVLYRSLSSSAVGEPYVPSSGPPMRALINALIEEASK